MTREGRRTGDLLAVLVTAPGELPGADRLVELLDGATGVLHAVNDGVAEVTAGLPATTLAGDRFRERILASSSSCRRAPSCRPTPRCATCSTATPWSSPTCGPTTSSGTCTAAPARSACWPRAVRPAGRRRDLARVGRRRPPNAARNGVENAEFIEGDVSKELRRLLELADRPSVVFVDPPRAGLSPKAVRRVIELAPERLVYVSCNPTTLAPNAAQLAEGGYRLERVQPVDMFPHTHHIECVARFTRA